MAELSEVERKALEQFRQVDEKRDAGCTIEFHQVYEKGCTIEFHHPLPAVECPDLTGMGLTIGAGCEIKVNPACGLTLSCEELAAVGHPDKEIE